MLHGSHIDCKTKNTGEHFPVKKKWGNFLICGKIVGILANFYFFADF